MSQLPLITLCGLSNGRAGKANVFKADMWEDYEFLPAAHSWFEPDPLAEEPGRGWIKIAGWLAAKNGWKEMDT